MVCALPFLPHPFNHFISSSVTGRGTSVLRSELAKLPMTTPSRSSPRFIHLWRLLSPSNPCTE